MFKIVNTQYYRSTHTETITEFFYYFEKADVGVKLKMTVKLIIRFPTFQFTYKRRNADYEIKSGLYHYSSIFLTFCAGGKILILALQNKNRNQLKSPKNKALLVFFNFLKIRASCDGD